MQQARKSMMGLYSSVTPIGYSRLHLFRKEWTVRKLRLRIYEIMRPLIKTNNKVNKKAKELNNLEAEYDSLFLDCEGNYDVDNHYYDIEIHNNIPQESGMFAKVNNCDFCG